MAQTDHRATRRFDVWFWGLLLVVTAGGLAVRLAAAEARVDKPLGGDALFYHEGANLLAEGHGFVNPYVYRDTGVLQQAADHPPLQSIYLAAWSAVGLRSQTAHLYAGVVLGTASIIVAGLAGRAVGGGRLGVLSALFVAAYPNVWRHDVMVMAETPAVFATLLTVWLAYRYWRRPTWPGLVAVGFAVGLATLARSELLLLAVFLVVPLALTTRARPAAQRWRWLGAAALACIVVIGPWTIANLVRLDRPVLLSSQFEVTFATANCDSTYYGDIVGYWDLACADRLIDQAGLTAQDPEAATMLSDAGRTYVREHLRRVPVVVAARLGRITGTYRPDQQAGIDALIEGNTRWVAEAGRWTLYPMMALAVAGAVVLRRRRVPVYPLLAPVGVVLLSVAVLYAATRFRAPADAAMCVLAAAALDAVLGRLRTHRPEEIAPDGQAAVGQAG